MKFAYTIIYVPDVPKALEFYEKTFGCKVRFLHEAKQYGEIETEGVVLAFASEETVRNHMGDFVKNDKSSPLPAGFEIAFSTDDVQKAYDYALSCGAQGIKSPMEKPWGATVAYVRDLNGIVVEICSA